MANGLDFGKLFENKLFLQYLSGAGGAISGGEPLGPALNQITQQNISAQNYLKILQKMLAGEVPDGGKITTDSKGTKIDIPKSALGNLSLAQEGSKLPGGSGIDWSKPENYGKLGVLNPFAESQSGEISAADLAGLTPENISQALQLKLTSEQLQQKNLTDLVDIIYKGALTQRALRPEPLEQPFPIEVPNVGVVTNRQWTALPQDQKEYAAYVHTAKKLGDADIMSAREFKMLDPTDREQFLRAAMEDPKLMAAARSLAKAGATRISLGEKVAEKKAFGELKGQLYFKDPKWTTDLSKYISSEDVQNKIFQSDKPDLERAKESIRFIESKITAGGGTIQEVKLSEDGKTMVWTVKWPSGDVETISNAIRP